MSIRNIDERILELLRIRAARHGRSMDLSLVISLVPEIRHVSGLPIAVH